MKKIAKSLPGNTYVCDRRTPLGQPDSPGEGASRPCAYDNPPNQR